jgi:hypothetical protein
MVNITSMCQYYFIPMWFQHKCIIYQLNIMFYMKNITGKHLCLCQYRHKIDFNHLSLLLELRIAVNFTCFETDTFHMKCYIPCFILHICNRISICQHPEISHFDPWMITRGHLFSWEMFPLSPAPHEFLKLHRSSELLCFIYTFSYFQLKKIVKWFCTEFIYFTYVTANNKHAFRARTNMEQKGHILNMNIATTM